jgi:hypothetical protein
LSPVKVQHENRSTSGESIERKLQQLKQMEIQLLQQKQEQASRKQIELQQGIEYICQFVLLK